MEQRSLVIGDSRVRYLKDYVSTVSPGLLLNDFVFHSFSGKDLNYVISRTIEELKVTKYKYVYLFAGVINLTVKTGNHVAFNDNYINKLPFNHLSDCQFGIHSLEKVAPDTKIIFCRCLGYH